jgi:hypothetical protein
MATVTKYEHKVEIIHEPSGEVLEFTFTADESTEPDEIFKQFCHDLSIIVHGVEEVEEELPEEDEDLGLKTGDN